jgi:hypothetical protein
VVLSGVVPFHYGEEEDLDHQAAGLSYLTHAAFDGRRNRVLVANLHRLDHLLLLSSKRGHC